MRAQEPQFEQVKYKDSCRAVRKVNCSVAPHPPTPVCRALPPHCRTRRDPSASVLHSAAPRTAASRVATRASDAPTRQRALVLLANLLRRHRQLANLLRRRAGVEASPPLRPPAAPARAETHARARSSAHHTSHTTRPVRA